jgi:hypothetical protein
VRLIDRIRIFGQSCLPPPLAQRPLPLGNKCTSLLSQGILSLPLSFLFFPFLFCSEIFIPSSFSCPLSGVLGIVSNQLPKVQFPLAGRPTLGDFGPRHYIPIHPRPSTHALFSRGWALTTPGLQLPSLQPNAPAETAYYPHSLV